ERDLGLQEIGKGELGRLDLRVRELDAEADAESMPLRGVEGRGPDGMEVEAARTRLHVAPVAADVEYVHEGQGSEEPDPVLELLPSFAHRERGAVLLPRVAHEAEAEIADERVRRRRGLDRVPPLVLVDAERPLVQAIADARSGTEVVALPEVDRHVGG